MLLNYLGFLIAAFAVIGNDVIQTLGTFLQSNKHQSWWKLFIYIGGILTIVLLAGWYFYEGDVSYGRLDKITRPEHLSFWHILPPILLLLITRYGIPVSTTFLVLSVFSSNVLIGSMLLKSFSGYLIAFGSAFLIYFFALHLYERFSPAEKKETKNSKLWLILQWCSTAFLWSQWLVQDFANIYVFLPPNLDFTSLLVSLAAMLIILAFIIQQKGGAIQKVVSSKTNSGNIRSATFVDFIYGAVLLFFTTVNDIPMSTTWAFVGILAGREIALRHRIPGKSKKGGWYLIGGDFLKVLVGVVVSVACVYLLKTVGAL